MGRSPASVFVTLPPIDLRQRERYPARHHTAMKVGGPHRASRGIAAWRSALALLCALLFVAQATFAALLANTPGTATKAAPMAVMVMGDMHHGGQPCDKGDGVGLRHCFMTAGCFASAIIGASALVLPERVARQHWPVLVAVYHSQAIDPQPRPPRAITPS